jgi:hypothetical protein
VGAGAIHAAGKRKAGSDGSAGSDLFVREGGTGTLTEVSWSAPFNYLKQAPTY